MRHLVGGGLQAKKLENITHFSDCPCKIILEGKKQAPFVNRYHWITTKKIGICSGTTLRGMISKASIRHQTEIGFGPSTNVYEIWNQYVFKQLQHKTHIKLPPSLSTSYRCLTKVKHLENSMSGNNAFSRVIMTHCLRKPICDSPLI